MPVILRHAFIPPDNRRLAHLCGSLDEHLRGIESALAVTVRRRNESFSIEGERAAAERAVLLLQTMYERSERPIAGDDFRVALLEARQDLLRAAAQAPRRRTRGTAGHAEARPDGSASAPTATPAGGDPQGDDEAIVLHTRRADLAGRTPNQIAYLRHILSHDISFGIGPAGTGKTFLAVACAVDALERNTVQRLVLTRPAVEAGERLGFLPGDLAQKVDPYLRPLYDALYDLMGFDRVTKAFEKGLIEIAPLAFMRGRTLNHAFVILDEAQNTTREQMKMFLTRIGHGSRAVVTGDISQIDLPRGMASGLVDAERVLRRVGGVAFTRFTSADVVRHPLVARIVEAYDAAEAAAEAPDWPERPERPDPPGPAAVTRLPGEPGGPGGGRPPRR